MSDSIFTRAFWSATGERAVKTFAQNAAAVLIVGGATGFLDADWKGVGSAALLAAILSILTSVAGNVATGTGPSFVSSEQVVPAESPKAVVQQTSVRTVDLDGDGRDDSTGRFVPKD